MYMTQQIQTLGITKFCAQENRPRFLFFQG